MADQINPTPDPAAATPAPSGIDSMMGSLPKVEEKPIAAAPAGDVKPPETKPDATPDATTKPDAKPDDSDVVWEKAPPKFKGAYFKFKRETGSKMEELNGKIKELEGRSVQSPEVLKKIKDAEEKVAQLQKSLDEREGTLRQSDYQRSAEFKDKFLTPITAAYNSAVEQVKKLQVKFTQDGEPQSRPATEQDFVDLINLGHNPAMQDEKAEEMFGHSARRVLNHINDLIVLRQKADSAIANANKTYEEGQKQFQTQQGQWKTEYDTAQTQVRGELVQKYPEVFGKLEGNDLANAALEDGYKRVDSIISGSENMTPAQRAEKVEIIRAWAAFFPRAWVLLQQERSTVKSLQSELSKYRKSDPGTAGGKPAPAATPTAGKGIEALFAGK